MYKKLLFQIFLLLFFFARPTYAIGEFESSYNITYDIKESGETRVTQDITLTNNLEDVYATSYVVKTNFTKITGVESSDIRGQQEVGVSQKNNETTITIKFNGQTVGKGNQVHFTLKYNTGDVAVKSGKIWEINIPKLGSGDFVEDYNVRILIPKSFGNPTYITPKPIRELIFDKNQLLKSGITAIFGDYQLYDFILKYSLKNDQNTPIRTEIALPPDTNYQRVSLKNLNPEPTNLTTDKDGNWLAEYELAVGQTLNIRAEGQIKSYMAPQNKVELTDAEKIAYTKEQKYWDSNDVDIKDRAAKLKTAKDIYEFVVNTLSYNYQRIGNSTNRLGGAKTLKEPDNSVCSEFTDLFISLARAAGIPARQVEGYANTQNSILRPLGLEKDILHAWPEYYDLNKKTWIQVDPTWGNTTKGVDYFNKLDFNHVAFVVKGLDSTYPYPAGSYKPEKSTEQYVDVRVTDSEEQAPVKDLVMEIIAPKKFISGFQNQGKVKITNPNEISLSNLLPNIIGDPIDASFDKISNITLPPKASIIIPFKLVKSSYIEKVKENLTLKVNDQKVLKEVDTEPIIPLQFIPLLILFVFGLFYVTIVRKKVKRSS